MSTSSSSIKIGNGGGRPVASAVSSDAVFVGGVASSNGADGVARGTAAGRLFSPSSGGKQTQLAGSVAPSGGLFAPSAAGRSNGNGSTIGGGGGGNGGGGGLFSASNDSGPLFGGGAVSASPGRKTVGFTGPKPSGAGKGDSSSKSSSVFDAASGSREGSGVAANITAMNAGFDTEMELVNKGMAVAAENLAQETSNTQEGPYIIVRQASPANPRNIDDYLDLKYHMNFPELDEFYEKYTNVPQSNIILERHQAALLAAQERYLALARRFDQCAKCRKRLGERKKCYCNCHRKSLIERQVNTEAADRLADVHERLFHKMKPTVGGNETAGHGTVTGLHSSFEQHSLDLVDQMHNRLVSNVTRLKDLHEQVERLDAQRQERFMRLADPKRPPPSYSIVFFANQPSFRDPKEFQPKDLADDSWMKTF